jgi:hypothetical protein
VQYDFNVKKPAAVSGAKVYWFDDTGVGGCRVPETWRLLYRDGTEWKPVPGVKEYPVAKDKFCEIVFPPVSTTALRLEADLMKGYSSGILEWEVKVGE